MKILARWFGGVLLTAALLGSGCRQSLPSPPITDPSPPMPGKGPQRAPSPAAPGGPVLFPLTVQDDLGRSVTFARLPRRIVTLQPSATEMAFALGLGDRVVGVTTFCDYPPEAQKKTKVGEPLSPNLERLLMLHPDLVLVPFGTPREFLERMEALKIPYLGQDPHTLEETLAWMRRIGQVAGLPAQAEKVVQALERRVAAVRQQTSRLPQKDRPVTLLVYWTDPLMSFGPHTFGDDLIRLAGGRNLMGQATSAYPVVNWETVLQSDPEVILLTGHTGKQQLSLQKMPGWTQLQAVRRGRVYEFSDGDLVTVPGPRLVDGLEQMARWLHPRLFPGTPAAAGR